MYWALFRWAEDFGARLICAAKASAPVHPTHQRFPFAHCTEINPAKGKTIHEIRHDPVIPAYDKGAGTVPGNDFHLGQGVLDGDRIGPESGVHVSIGQVVFQYLGQGDMPGEAERTAQIHWKSSVSTMRVSSSPESQPYRSYWNIL